MTKEEAIREAQKWAKADIWRCERCGDYVVVIYTDRHSNQWFAFQGGVDWVGIHPIHSCGGAFEFDE